MRRALHDSLRDLEILEWHEVEPGAGVEDLRDRTAAMVLLRRLASDPLNLMSLRAFIAAQSGPTAPARLSDVEVLERIAWQLESGRARIALHPALDRGRRIGLMVDGPLEALPALEPAPVPVPLEDGSVQMTVEVEELPVLEPGVEVEGPPVLEPGVEVEEPPVLEPGLEVEEPPSLETGLEVEEPSSLEPGLEVEEPRAEVA